MQRRLSLVVLRRGATFSRRGPVLQLLNHLLLRRLTVLKVRLCLRSVRLRLRSVLLGLRSGLLRLRSFLLRLRKIFREVLVCFLQGSELGGEIGFNCRR